MKQKLVIEIDEGLLEYITKGKDLSEVQNSEMAYAILDGTPLPKGHGRIGDLDILVKHNVISESYANMFTIIEADGGGEDDKGNE